LGGRWNSPGRAVISCAMLYAGALLEILGHAGTGEFPGVHQSVSIDIPIKVRRDPRRLLLPPVWWLNGAAGYVAANRR